MQIFTNKFVDNDSYQEGVKGMYKWIEPFCKSFVTIKNTNSDSSIWLFEMEWNIIKKGYTLQISDRELKNLVAEHDDMRTFMKQTMK